MKMPNHELRRLLAYQYSHKHAPTQAKRVTSRRTSKNAHLAVGMKFMRGGRIVPGVSMEKVFVERK